VPKSSILNPFHYRYLNKIIFIFRSFENQLHLEMLAGETDFHILQKPGQVIQWLVFGFSYAKVQAGQHCNVFNRKFKKKKKTKKKKPTTTTSLCVFV